MSAGVCAAALCVFLNGARVQPFITRADCRRGNAHISLCSFVTCAPAAHWTFPKAALTLAAAEQDPAATVCRPLATDSLSLELLDLFFTHGDEFLPGFLAVLNFFI